MASQKHSCKICAHKKAPPNGGASEFTTLKKTPKICVFQGLPSGNKQTIFKNYFIYFVRAIFIPTLVTGKLLAPIPLKGIRKYGSILMLPALLRMLCS